MSLESVSKYIEFQPAGESPSGKTKIWHVVNVYREDDYLGLIRWHGAWRKYVFEQEGTVFYDWDCLRLIARFIEDKTLEHRGVTGGDALKSTGLNKESMLKLIEESRSKMLPLTYIEREVNKL